MKKIITAVLLFLAVQQVHAQFDSMRIYTPEYSRTFHYALIDSGLAIKPRDTIRTRGYGGAGRLTVLPTDKQLYLYNGTKWNRVGIDSAGLATMLSRKVDSVKILSDTLFYYIKGIAYGSVFSVSSAYPISHSFDTTTGVFSTNRNGLIPITINLNGRYLEKLKVRDSVNAIGDLRYPLLTNSYSNPAWITSLPWSKITSTPTTLSGYGITDAYPLTGNPSGFLTTFSETDPTVSSIIKNIPVAADVTTNKYYYWNNGSIARKQILYTEISGTPTLSNGTVTNFAFTNGGGFTGSVANPTTTPTLSLVLQNATTSQSGQLTSTDWNTFNNKQPQLNGTGFVKASGTTITYDNSTYATTAQSGGKEDTSAAHVNQISINFPGVIFNTPANASVTNHSATLTPTLISQSANTFFAAPNGSAGTPIFRAIAAADLPSGNTSYIQNTTSQQASSNFNISGSGTLPLTTSSTTGVLYKSTFPFIHNFNVTGTQGSNTFVGINAGNFTMNTVAADAILASNNTIVGVSALAANTTGYRNVALGAFNLTNNTTGYYNTALGNNAMRFNISGDHNTAVGGDALFSMTTGSQNNAFGVDALQRITTGSGNVGIGNNALVFGTTGNQNIAIGLNSVFKTSTGSNNIGLGPNSLFNNVTGEYNVALGLNSLYNSLNGANTGVGSYSGEYITTGINNSFLGYLAGSNVLQKVDANNSTAIGYLSYTTKSNQVVIGNSSVTETLLNGNVGIGGTPTTKLYVGDNAGGTIAIASNEVNGTLASPLYLTLDYLGYQNSNKARIRATDVNASSFASTLSFLVNDGSGASGAALVERLTIKDGFMGVSNANPTERLDVSGNVRFSGALMPNNTAGTSGQVLQSNGAGVSPTWGTPAATGVTSITGTANRITASASTGAVTLTLPQDIATSSSPTFTGLTLSSDINQVASLNGNSTHFIRNNDVGTLSTARTLWNASGNSWSAGMGSSANNANAFSIREDALGVNTERFKIAIGGAATLGGSLTAGSFIKSGGTSSQFLKADGSVDANTYAIGSNYLPLSAGSGVPLTGALYANAMVRVSGGGAVPVSGAGLEIVYGSNTSNLTSFDRTGGVYKDLGTNSLSLSHAISGVQKINLTSTLLTITPITYIGGYLRVEGAGAVPVSGSGLEMVYSNTTGGNFTSFDRGGGAYKSLSTNSLDLSFNISGVERMKLSSAGILSLATAPTTSASTYDILTRNITTGIIEKIASGSVSGADALGRYLVQTATNAPANAQVMGSLGTGIVKNTTSTGVQSIAVAADFPTLNQNTTGSAATIAVTADATTSSNVSLLWTNSSGSSSSLGVSSTGAKVFMQPSTGNLTTTGNISAANLSSGTYTPNLVNGANAASSTAYLCQYMRVGNTVTVSGKIDITPTTTSATTQVTISLPITSNFTLSNHAGGTGVATTAATGRLAAAIYANTSASTVTIDFVVGGSAVATSFPFSFTYQIL